MYIFSYFFLLFSSAFSAAKQTQTLHYKQELKEINKGTKVSLLEDGHYKIGATRKQEIQLLAFFFGGGANLILLAILLTVFIYFGETRK